MFSHGVTPPSSSTLKQVADVALPNMPYWSLTARSEQAALKRWSWPTIQLVRKPP